MPVLIKAYGIPETLHHDDFHDGNIFVQREGTSINRYTLPIGVKAAWRIPSSRWW
ncbi:MAG: hypothetical protein R2911_17890 [Caldilineaceae bacterium]